MADRNVKFKIYESQGVPYYLIFDPDKKKTEIFKLVEGTYQFTETSVFLLDANCLIEIDLKKLWL